MVNKQRAWELFTLLNPVNHGAWDTYKIHYRYRQTVYHISISRLVETSAEASVLTLDEKVIHGALLPLVDDQREHYAELKVRAIGGV